MVLRNAARRRTVLADTTWRMKNFFLNPREDIRKNLSFLNDAYGLFTEGRGVVLNLAILLESLP